jgi:glutathione S-transferase
MSLKLYGNLLSQPCRAIFMLLKACQIPYEFELVDMAKGMLLNNTECSNFPGAQVLCII